MHNWHGLDFMFTSLCKIKFQQITNLHAPLRIAISCGHCNWWWDGLIDCSAGLDPCAMNVCVAWKRLMGSVDTLAMCSAIVPWSWNMARTWPCPTQWQSFNTMRWSLISRQINDHECCIVNLQASNISLKKKQASIKHSKLGNDGKPHRSSSFYELMFSSFLLSPTRRIIHQLSLGTLPSGVLRLYEEEVQAGHQNQFFYSSWIWWI